MFELIALSDFEAHSLLTSIEYERVAVELRALVGAIPLTSEGLADFSSSEAEC